MSRYILENVVCSYSESRTGRRVEALRVPQFEVEAGEILAVVGPNGSGKSTLLETMAFLNRPDRGRLLLDGVDVWAGGDMLAARRRCPILLQRTVLFKTTVLKNVMYGLRVRNVERNEARRRAESVLKLVGLDNLAHRGHRELSGGERQRVALARLLVLEPDVLLLDEPTTYVDQHNELMIERAIAQLHERTNATIVLASHSFRQAKALAHRVVTLVDGRIIPGTMDNLFAGTLVLEHDRFVFRNELGVMLRFDHSALASESVNFSDIAGKPAQIVIEADRLDVVHSNDARDTFVTGRIVSIRQHRDRCRLQVISHKGCVFHADMSITEYSRLKLNIGMRASLALRPGAVHVLATSNSPAV